MRGRRLWATPRALALVVLLLLLSAWPGGWPVQPATAQQVLQGEDVLEGGTVVGRFFRQGDDGAGFEVREPFLSALRDLGGPAAVGPPVSAPFLDSDGCTYQTFQVLMLQACPGGAVRAANTFEILERAGADGRLLGLGVGGAEHDTGEQLPRGRRHPPELAPGRADPRPLPRAVRRRRPAAVER